MVQTHFFLFAIISFFLQNPAAHPPWTHAEKVNIASSLDGASQPAMYYSPRLSTPRPLLVALHSWSGGFDQDAGRAYLSEAINRKWGLIHPHFRGPNRTSAACASKFAIQDVLDSIVYVRTQMEVDEGRIYLVGASGGGHMALVMAHSAPDLWAGVSSWVPISDLSQWHEECRNSGRKYADDIEAVCGGPPNQSRIGDYRRRSPLFHLQSAGDVPLSINAGVHDGHTGSVPVGHSIRAFNVVAAIHQPKIGVIGVKDIRFIEKNRRIPSSLRSDEPPNIGRKHKVLLHRKVHRASLTIFDGGHEIDVPAACRWLANLHKH